MKTRNFTSILFNSAYNALLAGITVSFILILTSFVMPMPSVIISVLHWIMLVGICLALPAVIIILYRYHNRVKRRIFSS